jgi:hypothetical protein
MALACDYASLRDDYYDHESVNVTEFRSLRRQLRRVTMEAATVLYIQQLRRTERNRPAVSSATKGIEEAAIAYRTRVLDLTLQWLDSISNVNVDPVKYQSLLSVACLLQIADDLLDFKEDQALQCPGYVTAFAPDRSSAEIAIALRAQADALLERTNAAARQDASGVPFSVAGALTWAFIIALLHLRFPR